MRSAFQTLQPRRPLEHFGPRTYTSFTDLPALLVTVLVVALAVAAWQAAYLAGGSKTPLPHVFYLAIILAAVRFGFRAAVLTALLSGVLAGPLLPADTLTAAPQTAVGWLTRLGIFIAVGAFVAWITSHTRPNLLTTGRDAQAARQIRRALRAGHIHVHYQPQVDLASGQPVGVEALARWLDTIDGVRPPAEFVPAAERTGLIKDIDTIVMQQALRQLADWDRQEFPGLTMAVNVSAQWFHDPALIDTVTALLEQYDVAPDRLHIEITETSIIADSRATARQTTALRALGVKVAIDDFGAGQTSLSYLHHYGIDIVKIDRSFTANTVDDANVSRLVGGMVRLFDTMGFTVVCEGIETADQYQHVRSLGAGIGQGYYIAQPAAAEEITAWLAKRRRRAQARPTSERNTDC